MRFLEWLLSWFRAVPAVPEPVPPAVPAGTEPARNRNDRLMPLPVSDMDVRVAAATLWGEARGEPHDGQVAVAWVMRNRLENPRWWCRGVQGAPDDTLRAVCRKDWQFSVWKEPPHITRMVRMINRESNADSMERQLDIVGRVFGGMVPDPTHGSDHYYAVSMPEPPKWAIPSRHRATIGRHKFYRLEI